MYQIDRTLLMDVGVYAVLLAAGLLAGWLARMLRETAVPRTYDTAITRFEAAMFRWQRMTQAAEGTLLDNVAATTPWLAPLLPASIAYANMRVHLGFDWWLAFVGALVIEFLGLAAVHTSFQLWQYNETRNQSDEAAPFWWAVGSVGIYLTIVILVNIILEAANVIVWTPPAWASISSKALLSLLSIVAAFVLALRSQHARRLALKQVAHDDRARAAELGRLRKEVGQLKDERDAANQQATELGQACAAMRTERDGLASDLDKVRRAETKVRQERDTAVAELEALRRIGTLWGQLPPAIQAAVVYHAEGGTTRELAETFGTNKTAVSREARRLFTENGSQ